MGDSPIAATEPRIVASDHSWIESKAAEQLRQTAASLGMTAAVGLPDLHPGKGVPNGAAFLHGETVYPHLVGEDVGCGYGLFRLDLPRRKLKIDKAAEKLATLEDAAAERRDAALAETEAEDDPQARSQLGTVGGGNHFAELLGVDAPGEEAGADDLFVLIHSGSRGLGGRVFRAYAGGGLDPDSARGVAYRAEHDRAVAWAAANRRALAMGVADRLGADLEQVLDAPHNLIEARSGGWLHRKGVQPADRPLLPLPGSRGAATHLIRPIAQEAALWSVAHGAGRKWARSEARGRLGSVKAADLSRTALGSRVICGDRALLFEETPEAYKPVDQVLDDLAQAGLAEPLARLRPLVTFKQRPAEARPRAARRTDRGARR